MQLTKIHTDDKYDFYVGCVYPDTPELEAYNIYNIVPKDTEAPQGGYRSMAYIEHIKHTRFPERYQPSKPEVLNYERIY